MGAAESTSTSYTPDIVFVHAEWCSYCKSTMPHWQEFVRTYGNRYTTLMVDGDSAEPSTAKYRAMTSSYPTFIVHGVPRAGSKNSAAEILALLEDH